MREQGCILELFPPPFKTIRRLSVRLLAPTHLSRDTVLAGSYFRFPFELMDDGVALELELPFRDWDAGLRRWRLPQAVVPSVTGARLWIDNTDVPEGAFRLANAHLEKLSADWEFTSEHSARAALKLRKSTQLSSYAQSLILACVGIAPAILTLLITDGAPRLSRTDLRGKAMVSMAVRMDEAIKHDHNIRLVSYWLRQWGPNASLAEALNNEANLTFTCLDSTSKFLGIRSLDVKQSPTFALDRLRTGLLQLAQLRNVSTPERLASQFSFRFHRSLGSVLILRSDDTYFVGPYFRGKSVSDAFVFEVTAGPRTQVAASFQAEIAYAFAEGATGP